MHTNTSRRPRAFFIAGDRIIHIANPCGAGLTYQGHAASIAPGAQSEPAMHLTAETVIIVEDGTLEIMINGAATSIAGGQYARVAPGQFFAWRNSDRRTAHILVKTAPPAQHHRACRVTFSIAAA